MFEPMSARFASSCSRNGISAVATDTIWRGDTSMWSTSLGSRSSGSPNWPFAPWPLTRQSTFALTNLPVVTLNGSFACAMT